MERYDLADCKVGDWFYIRPSQRCSRGKAYRMAKKIRIRVRTESVGNALRVERLP